MKVHQKGYSESCLVQNVLYVFCLNIFPFSLLSANGHSHEVVLVRIVHGVFVLIVLHILPLLSLDAMNQITLDKEDPLFRIIEMISLGKELLRRPGMCDC